MRPRRSIENWQPYKKSFDPLKLVEAIIAG